MVVVPRRIRSWVLVVCLGLLTASCSGDKGVLSVSIPAEAEAVGPEALVTPELVTVAELRPGDELFRLPVGEFSVLVRLRAGEAPLLFGTSCDVVSAAALPTGWQGVCLEYTEDGQRVFGQFPWGTTSAGT
jgi:hypothetical protein